MTIHRSDENSSEVPEEKNGGVSEVQKTVVSSSASLLSGLGKENLEKLSVGMGEFARIKKRGGFTPHAETAGYEFGSLIAWIAASHDGGYSDMETRRMSPEQFEGKYGALLAEMEGKTFAELGINVESLAEMFEHNSKGSIIMTNLLRETEIQDARRNGEELAEVKDPYGDIVRGDDIRSMVFSWEEVKKWHSQIPPKQAAA